MRRVQSPDPALAQVQDNIAAELQRLERSARSAGEVTEVRTGRCAADWDQTVLVDPSGGAVTVILPVGDAAHVGSSITIKNLSASTNGYTVQAQPGELIDGNNTHLDAAAWGCVRLQLVRVGTWAEL